VLDIGAVVGDFVIVSIAFDRPGSWFVSCGNGHERLFATSEMLENGEVVCKECTNSEKTKMDTLAALYHSRAIGLHEFMEDKHGKPKH
jgi:hypothetical protein